MSVPLHTLAHVNTRLQKPAHTYTPASVSITSTALVSSRMSTYARATCTRVLTATRLCVQARSLQAVPRLVKLFNHANQEVQRHATGAMRNLIYDNADNKLALVEENGIFELLRTLREQDDELRKNVTGGPARPQPRANAAAPCLSAPSSLPRPHTPSTPTPLWHIPAPECCALHGVTAPRPAGPT